MELATKIGDDKQRCCEVKFMRDHLNHEIEITCDNMAKYPCNRSISYNGTEYFEGCDKMSCKEHTYFDLKNSLIYACKECEGSLTLATDQWRKDVTADVTARGRRR